MSSLADTLRYGLLNPLGFASLKDILFPEDKIVIVPDNSCIGRPEIIKEIIAVFIEHGIPSKDISVLLTGIDHQTNGKNIAADLPVGVEMKVFNPSMNGSLALLGVDKSGQPVAMCRHLVDADMVITVGEWRKKSSGDYFGIHSVVFPRFSSVESQQRFAAGKGAERKKLQKEAENAAQLLGIVFTVQFVIEGKKSKKDNSEEKLCFVSGLPQLVTDAAGGSAQS